MRGYMNRAVSLRESSVKNQCEILCKSLEIEGYLDNLDSPTINSELSLLSNVYNGFGFCGYRFFHVLGLWL